MPLNGSGTFVRAYNWTADKLAGIKILSTRMDDEMDGFADAHSLAIYRDGQAPFSADQSMGNNRLTNVADPTSDQDAMNRRTADSRYGTLTQVRLTLTSGVAVTESDVTGAGTVYMTPDGSNSVGLYDGTSWVARVLASDAAMALDASGHLANKNYDIFAFWDGSVVKTGTAAAWSSDIARGTGSGTSEIEFYQGRLVNKFSVTLRNAGVTVGTVPARRGLLVGGFRVGSIAGQTEDSKARRFLSNVYGRTARQMLRQETAASWTYVAASNAWRQANANALNKVEWFSCVGGDPINLDVFVTATNSTSTQRTASVGIGIDKTNATDATVKSVLSVGPTATILTANYSGYPGIGYHSGNWIELSGLTDTRTFIGNGSLLTPVAIETQSAIYGTVIG